MNVVTPDTDAHELEKFELLSQEWWNPTGKLKTLHHINPVRLRYIDNAVGLNNKNVLDIGCGGGLLSEAMVEKGALVTGIDASKKAIAVAIEHARQTNKKIDYKTVTATEFARDNQQSFDVIVCMELLEHVDNVQTIVTACAQMLKPGGDLILATINRTLKAYLTAIVGAEYILQLLPKGTHAYAKFIKPSELDTWLRQAGFRILDIAGMTYIPGLKFCSISNNPAVNYLVHARFRD